MKYLICEVKSLF